MENYFDLLRKYLKLNLVALDRVRHIIQRNVEKGLLPNYALKIMNMDTQYNTIGIIGLYEALQEFGMTRKDAMGYTYYTPEGMQFASKVLSFINKLKETIKSEFKWNYSINVEQIPGERAAAILMEKDQLFYPNKRYELPLYGNQWIPLAVKCTLQEKIRISAELDKACGGGSIAHINLEAPLKDFDTAWKLLNYVSDAGVTYFAFNLKIDSCKNNHGFFGSTCPHCGNPKETSYQRIVGFLVPEKTYSSARKKEFLMRDWFDLVNQYED